MAWFILSQIFSTLLTLLRLGRISDADKDLEILILRQQQIYEQILQTETYRGLDMSPTVVALNRANGVGCIQGDALNGEVMQPFTTFDVLFFGPPLSKQCDGHTGLPFQAVSSGFAPFARLLLEELSFMGLLVCICPNSTNLGDVQWLYRQIQAYRADAGLRLIHHSYATLAGADEPTEMRLKYVELWFSARLSDLWVVRKSWEEGIS